MKKTISKGKSQRKSVGAAKPAKHASTRNGAWREQYPIRTNPHGIPDYRLEIPNFRTVEEWVDGQFHYKVEGDLSAEPPPLRESKYLNKDQTIEIYRYMLLNRKM